MYKSLWGLEVLDRFLTTKTNLLESTFNKRISQKKKEKSVCSPSISSKEVIWGLVVQRELAWAVAGHADTHETQQESHARRSRALPALHHSLGCLGLKERAGVTTTTQQLRQPPPPGTTIIARDDPPGDPPGSGCGWISEQVALVAHLLQPGNRLTIREQPC